MIRAVPAKPIRFAMAAPRSKIPPSEIIETDSTTVSCDGGGGALGHPRVYLNLGADGAVDCGYCDRRFVLKAGAKAGAH
jgi:uncharacterized Zn-finger protein